MYVRVICLVFTVFTCILFLQPLTGLAQNANSGNSAQLQTNTNCLIGSFFCATSINGSRSWTFTQGAGEARYAQFAKQQLQNSNTSGSAAFGSSGGATGGGSPGSLQIYILMIGTFMNDILVPFIIALAFLFFIWNAARYFILQGQSDDARSKARQFALWGILGLVFMISIWGIVNAFVGGVGINRAQPVCPDYNPNCDSGQFGGGVQFGNEKQMLDYANQQSTGSGWGAEVRKPNSGNTDFGAGGRGNWGESEKETGDEIIKDFAF